MSLWKKSSKPEPPAGDAGGGSYPRIEAVLPRAAIPGGELQVIGNGFTENGRSRPTVKFGEQAGSLLMSSPNRLIVRVPEGAASGELTIDNGKAVSAPLNVAVGTTIAENLHPVANPAQDADGNIYSTFSGSRGQKVPVSVYKIDTHHVVHPFVPDGTIYQITHEGHRSVYAQGMGVATGIAFDGQGNLYVGDRTGTIFKINSDRQIFVFATLEPSVAAFHLAFSPKGSLFVSGPTTSSFDHILEISPAGEVKVFYRGLGRPQGMAFDASGNLYVAASLGGRRGVVRITPDGTADLAISGYGIVGLTFTRKRSLVLATNGSLVEVPVGIEGLPLIR
jgi:IPT/TIG domain